MKRFFLFTFPILFVSCAFEAETITFNDGQFEALKPGTWLMMSDLNDQAELQMGNTFAEAYCIVMVEAKPDMEAMTLSQYSDVTRGYLRDAIKDYSEKGPERMAINGRPAIRYELRGVVDKVKIIYWHVVIEFPNHYHQAMVWSLPSKFEGNRSNFDKVLHSIRATK